MSNIKIVLNRSDIGAGTRGSDMGPDAIEIAAINQENHYFNRYPSVDVKSHNESVYDKVKANFAKRIGFVLEQCNRVVNSVNETITEGFFPVVLSGDHSSAMGTIAGVKKTYPDQRLGVIWIDAHADLHSPFTSPSGNVHGMPLAASLGFNNTQHQINRVSEGTQALWEQMKNIGIDGPKLTPDDLILFGVRDTELPEERLMERHGIRNYMVHEIRYRGLDTCLDEAIAQLDHCEKIYISFDVDSMDCDLISKGTGTPVSKGFDIPEVIQIIDRWLLTNKVCCLEICEVNPLLDTKGNRMAEAAFEVLDAITPNL